MESAEVEESERWFLPIMDVVDRAADVRLSLIETCFSGQSVENKLAMRLKTRGVDDEDNEVEWVTLEDSLTAEVSAMGRIAGDERWLVGQNERMEIVVLHF